MIKDENIISISEPIGDTKKIRIGNIFVTFEEHHGHDIKNIQFTHDEMDKIIEIYNKRNKK